jgi:heme-degrading monooxygenase HmoA
MFARLVRFKHVPGSETKAQELADELAPLIADQLGCQAVTIFGDHGDGEYGIYVLWDTREHADAAAGLVRPQLDKHLAGSVTAPPEPRLFGVLRSM